MLDDVDGVCPVWLFDLSGASLYGRGITRHTFKIKKEEREEEEEGDEQVEKRYKVVVF